MSGSFRKIDYSIRPAKYAERRMLRDVFRRVSPFAPPEEYTYIGFGSVWFSDFVLFHRSLGVKSMISIESSKAVKQRVSDNAPFQIDLRFGHSNSELQKLDWSRRSFVWLDYDDKIDKLKLNDIRFVSKKAPSGSLLAVSVRSDSAREFDQATTDDAIGALSALDRFKEHFDVSQYPPEIAEEDLTGRPFATLCRTMITTEIGSSLNVRNRRAVDPMRFRPICAFSYADGAEMTTVVGLFHSESDSVLADRCGFCELDFITNDDGNVDIEVPLLTIKELRALEAQMPVTGEKDLSFGSIPENEGRKFQKFYRYFPNYVVLEG